MTKTLLLAAALLTAPAAIAGERTFTREGVTYNYTSSTKGAKTVIRGNSSNGSAYTLTVRGRSVSGVVSGTPVSFTIAKPFAVQTLGVETASVD